MVDLKRRQPEPLPGPPRVARKYGLADELLAEIAPMRAEDGVDVNSMDALNLATLQGVMDRAVARRNMALFTPAWPARAIAAAALGQVVESILNDGTILAAAILDQVQPESPDISVATVRVASGCP